MTFVVVGGGPTGVELAGALGEISRDTLRRDFRSIDPPDARILLVEAMDRVLPTYPPDRSRVGAAPARAARGRVRTGTRVVHVDERHVRVQVGDRAQEIAARTVLWAAGVQASSFAGRSRPHGRGDGPGRPDRRRPRPGDPGPSRDLRRSATPRCSHGRAAVPSRAWRRAPSSAGQ